MVYTSANPSVQFCGPRRKRPPERSGGTGEKEMGMRTDARGCGHGRKDHKLRTLGCETKVCGS